MAEQQQSLTEQIDFDEGLKSKRKLLTVTSLILLALSFSSAKVEEANTFILKLKFENQNGIGILLVLAIIFLLIRYYNYARPYHYKIYRAWSDRMLENRYFYTAHPYESDIEGLLIDRAPKQVDVHAIRHEGGGLSFEYKCSPPFCRKFIYSWSDEHDYNMEHAGIGWKNYFKVILYEIKYQFESFFTHRENLDVLSPYILGLISIASYFFNDSFQEFIKMLAVN